MRNIVTSWCLALAAIASLATAAVAGNRIVRISDRVFLVLDQPGSTTRFEMIVNAGSAEEKDGRSLGLAHFLEHLVLNGRNTNNGDKAVRFFPDGLSNGSTNRIATRYKHSMPARSDRSRGDLDKLFQFYATQLRTADYDPDMAQRERKVVLQEHDLRYTNNAALSFDRKIDAVLFHGHPIAYWTIGTRASIMALTVDDARAFHDRWYHVNNVWFVIKGDVEPAALRTIAARHLKPLQPGVLPQRTRLGDPDLHEEDVALSIRDSNVQEQSIYFRKLVRLPSVDPLKTYATSLVLRNILRTKLKGSLYDTLVEKHDLAEDDPVFSIQHINDRIYEVAIDAQPSEGVAGNALLAAIAAYVRSLNRPGFSQHTLDRIKARLARAQEHRDADPDRTFSRLVSWLAAGRSYEDMERFPGLLQAVTFSDVKQLASIIAGRGRIVTGILSPVETKKQ